MNYFDNYTNNLSLDQLKARASRCVCKYCGHSLKVERLMYHNCEAARSELFCPNCQRIEFGIEREIYAAAKYYIDSFHLNMFPGLEDNEQTRRMNIAKVAEIMDWQNTHLGLTNHEGFCVPLNIQSSSLGRTSIFTDADLTSESGE